jgi:hypothetical protein
MEDRGYRQFTLYTALIDKVLNHWNIKRTRMAVVKPRAQCRLDQRVSTPSQICMRSAKPVQHTHQRRARERARTYPSADLSRSALRLLLARLCR